MFSSRFSRLNHWRILVRALALFARPIQPRAGPLALGEVTTSTMSPFSSLWSKLTMRPFTRAAVMWFPTWEWME